MSWLDRFNTQERRLQTLLDANRYREAMLVVAEPETPNPEEAELAIAKRAATHWLAEADRACRAGDRERMNSSMAEAARYHREELRTAFLETRRRIRDHTLSLTVASHWDELLKLAANERNRLHDPDEAPPPAFATFAIQSLTAGLEAEEIAAMKADALEERRVSVRKTYPGTLWARVDQADREFLRAALLVAAGRPDLAVPLLLELSDADPLVCLERGRTAYALGQVSTAMLALGDFAMLHGSHETVRRLNTGVFMAQMAEMVGDARRAVEILERVPLAQVGRRPVLLLARLYGEIDRSERGRSLLLEWLRDHPDDVEASVLLGALR